MTRDVFYSLCHSITPNMEVQSNRLTFSFRYDRIRQYLHSVFLTQVHPSRVDNRLLRSLSVVTNASSHNYVLQPCTDIGKIHNRIGNAGRIFLAFHHASPANRFFDTFHSLPELQCPTPPLPGRSAGTNCLVP